MKDNFISFDSFLPKYELFEMETVDDIINCYSAFEQDKRPLIEVRQKQRDCELVVMRREETVPIGQRLQLID